MPTPNWLRTIAIVENRASRQRLESSVNRPPIVDRRYDPESIARRFRWQPWRPAWRAIRIAVAFLGFVLGLKLDQIMGLEEGAQQARAEQIRCILTDLGPTFVKVGQALSTRPDLVRQDFLDELIKLQDQLPPFPNSVAFGIIESEFDRSVNEIFREISPNPIAAASLGQVYKAKLYSGEEVAVKVQRPNLKPTLILDLYLMRWFARNLGWLLPVNIGDDLALIVDEFGTKLFEETDYENEGNNAEKFAENFKNDPLVKVPKIYWDYSSHRVLTLEWIDGVKLTDTEQVKARGLDRDSIIEIGVTSGLKQLLEYGFFHADPHPGNLFAMAPEPGSSGPGRMAFIDFGMMDQLDEPLKEALVDAIVHLINQDYEQLVQDFVQLGFLTPGTDIRPIIPALEAVFADVMGKSVGDFNFKVVTDKFSGLMYEYPFRVPAKFALIIRSVVTQEGLALSLNPDFKIVEIGYPYIARRLLTGESESLRRRLLEVLFKDGKFQWQRLENMIQIARGDQSFDILPTAQLGAQYLFSEDGAYLRRLIVMSLTEDNRLHTDDVARLWRLVKDDIKPDKIAGAAWNALVQFSTDRVTSLIPATIASLTSRL
jgi:predicted unusual protein kinase regulating ubiquinone biosynthesis (AarF/ABC1/UbiB family)